MLNIIQIKYLALQSEPKSKLSIWGESREVTLKFANKIEAMNER